MGDFLPTLTERNENLFPFEKNVEKKTEFTTCMSLVGVYNVSTKAANVYLLGRHISEDPMTIESGSDVETGKAFTCMNRKT